MLAIVIWSLGVLNNLYIYLHATSPFSFEAVQPDPCWVDPALATSWHSIHDKSPY